MSPTSSRSPFWHHVEKRSHRDGCWAWTGKTDPDGYGIDDRGRRAHRVAWEQKNGPIPRGKVLDHWRCDNTRCVRSSHMKVCTNFANLERAYDQGKLHSPRLRAYVEIGRRARAKYGETSEARRRAWQNYRAWRRQHAAQDAIYAMRRAAEDRLSGAIGGIGMIKRLIWDREHRDQLPRPQRLIFAALLAEEQMLGTLALGARGATA